MTCVHKVRWSVKRPENCRFRLSVSHYKDRIVAPDEYSGVTTVTPSDETQTLATQDKLVRSDIVVNPAPTEILSTDHNGTFTPSDGHVGFSQVNVDVQPDLRPLSVSENGQYMPDGFDGYASVVVDVAQRITPDDIANATISGAITLTATTIKRAYSFAEMPITSIDAPNLVSIQALATVGGGRGGLFLQCRQLTRVNAPNLKDVPMETFMNCSSLTDISFASIL